MSKRKLIRAAAQEGAAMIAAAADARLSEREQRQLLIGGMAKVHEAAGGPAAVLEGERRLVMRLREQSSASSQPALQRGGRSRANDRANLPELGNVGRRGGDVSTEIEEAVLTSKARKSLSTSQFAIPERRAYPVMLEMHSVECHSMAVTRRSGG